MNVEHAEQNSTPEEQKHLEQLRALVTKALADGSLSQDDIQGIKALIYADHKVTAEELDTVHDMIRTLLGEAALEFEWN